MAATRRTPTTRLFTASLRASLGRWLRAGARRRRPGVEPGTHGCRSQRLNRSAAESSANGQIRTGKSRAGLGRASGWFSGTFGARLGHIFGHRGAKETNPRQVWSHLSRVCWAGGSGWFSGSFSGRIDCAGQASGAFGSRNPSNGFGATCLGFARHSVGLVFAFGSVLDVLSHRSKRAHASFRRRPRRRDFFWEYF